MKGFLAFLAIAGAMACGFFVLTGLNKYRDADPASWVRVTGAAITNSSVSTGPLRAKGRLPTWVPTFGADYVVDGRLVKGRFYLRRMDLKEDAENVRREFINSWNGVLYAKLGDLQTARLEMPSLEYYAKVVGVGVVSGFVSLCSVFCLLRLRKHARQAAGRFPIRGSREH